SEWIRFSPNVDFSLSIWNNTISNTIKVFWYSSSKEFIKGEERTSEQKHFTLSGKSPKGSSYVRIEVLEAKTTQIQFEIGESSPYKLSLYDLMNNVVLAKKQVEIREKM